MLFITLAYIINLNKFAATDIMGDCAEMMSSLNETDTEHSVLTNQDDVIRHCWTALCVFPHIFPPHANRIATSVPLFPQILI